MAEDLMHQDEIRDLVRHAYRSIPTGGGLASAQRFYSAGELADLPGSAIAWSLGVGNPVRHAELADGEVVLDVGSGGGIDTILAARRVGRHGLVIGLDMLAEMCARGETAAKEAGVADHCEFRHGLMEDIPVDDDSVDVVISNGVINLSPRKSRVLAEINRVLRPGGRMCIADLTVDDNLPREVLTSESAWAGCIAGALSEPLFRDKLRRAGLVDVEMSEQTPFTLDDVALYPLFTDDVLDLIRRLLSDRAQQRIATSVIARARKPTRN
jgi:SAM-dependent methyltransferase